MRIIAGQYRGKKLCSPNTEGVRPTADRARESIFNILGSKISNAWDNLSLLELFAGTGAFSLEAISRGIKEACLIDINTENAKKNLLLFPKEQEKIRLIKSDALHLPQAQKNYNLLFMDAPYNQGLSEPALMEVAAKGWLADDCLCVVEVEKNESFVPPQGFSVEDERIYGLAKFCFLTLK